MFRLALDSLVPIFNFQIIERREWKPFRQMIRQWDQVKKCGRNFIRFCDADSNRKISIDEWMDCTLKGIPLSSFLLQRQN